MLQMSRRTVQVIIILLIVAMPLISFYGRILSGKGQREVSEVALGEEGRILGSIYVIIDKIYSPVPNAREAVIPLDGFKGGTWSLTIFGFNITDPLAGIVAMIGSQGFYMPLFISMLLPLLFILLFGRAFCAWICPMNTLFEINNGVRNKIERYIFKPADNILDRNLKYIVLVVALMLTAGGVSLLPYLLPYALVTRQPYYYIFYRTFGIGMGIIFLMFLFELFVSRRGWCRYLCPGGAFFSLLGQFRLVRVGRDPSGCFATCNLCTQACKMGLSPHQDRTGMECDNCGLCVSACPSNAMKYRIGARGKGQGAEKQNKLVGGQWSVVRSLFLFFMVSLIPHPLSLIPEVYAAHAKLINPHAGDSENTGELTFPQAPSEEHSVIVDGYLISFSVFQFREMEQRGIKVKSVITVKDRSGTPYLGPLTMDIEELGLFGKVQSSSHTFEKAKDNRYPRFDWFSSDARCRVKVVFRVEDKFIRTEFPLKVGDPLPSGIFIGSLGLILASVIGLVVYINKKGSKGAFVPAG